MSTASRFKPYAPDVQAVIRLAEALPADHPVHVFVDLVRSIDLTHFVIPPGPKGEKPYHPHALFGVLAWGYLHGVRSSRKLARWPARKPRSRAWRVAASPITARWRASAGTTPPPSRPSSRRRCSSPCGWGWRSWGTWRWTGPS